MVNSFVVGAEINFCLLPAAAQPYQELYLIPAAHKFNCRPTFPLLCRPTCPLFCRPTCLLLRWVQPHWCRPPTWWWCLLGVLEGSHRCTELSRRAGAEHEGAERQGLYPGRKGWSASQTVCRQVCLEWLHWMPSYSLWRARLHNCPGVLSGSAQCEELWRCCLLWTNLLCKQTGVHQGWEADFDVLSDWSRRNVLDKQKHTEGTELYIRERLHPCMPRSCSSIDRWWVLIIKW